MNLILNAREAMLPGGGTLTIGAGSTENSVIITVGDTGCGIDSENFDRIFESFFTTKTGDSDSERTGAGLGLAFCKRVIDAHKGSISVDSQPGKGTTFRVALPKG